MPKDAGTMVLNRKPTKLITSVFAIAYAVLMVLYHDWAQQFVIAVQRDPVWTWSTFTGSVLILLSLALLFVRLYRLQTAPGRERLLLISWIVTVTAIGFAQWLLVSVHTEAIHYLQYGLFTAIVFHIVRRIPSTLIIVIMVGMIDEGYQYWFLYPDWPVYYDVNDVILNTLAGALTLLFLASTIPNAFADDTSDPWIVKNIDLVVLGGTALLLVAGIGFDLIALYRFPVEASSGAWLILNRTEPAPQFWSLAWWSGRYYHQVPFVHGMIAVVLIAQYYRFSIPPLLHTERA